ncbi:hypothetical protein DFH08DRAFT_818376 [Mycena albidolilacea]|uniref:Uncharacterized protein n=1 Tax=Mycena albidolilacea TaxID=1033008 RepID=A0AAD7EHU5_9AGAR|nr:hypothetical protein DFH08DRAFT_818376 [Mycena albidolilacea]
MGGALERAPSLLGHLPRVRTRLRDEAEHLRRAREIPVSRLFDDPQPKNTIKDSRPGSAGPPQIAYDWHNFTSHIAVSNRLAAGDLACNFEALVDVVATAARVSLLRTLEPVQRHRLVFPPLLRELAPSANTTWPNKVLARGYPAPLTKRMLTFFDPEGPELRTLLRARGLIPLDQSSLTVEHQHAAARTVAGSCVYNTKYHMLERCWGPFQPLDPNQPHVYAWRNRLSAFAPPESDSQDADIALRSASNSRRTHIVHPSSIVLTPANMRDKFNMESHFSSTGSASKQAAADSDVGLELSEVVDVMQSPELVRMGGVPGFWDVSRPVDKGKGKATESDEVEGWDWAGVEGEWRKRSEKQLAVTAGLNGARLRSINTGKENILPDTSIPPRRSTRAQDYVKTLEARINDQETQILSLEASNSAYQADNHLLHTCLDDSYSQIESLEKDQATTTERLSTAEHDLSIANEMISSQALVLNETFWMLLTKSHAIRIETLLTTIHHLNRKIDSHRAEKIQIRKTLKSTQMRESRAKSALERTRTALKQKSRSLSTSHRTYITQYRSLALAFTRAGCAQARIGGLLTRAREVLGVRLKRSMSRRTVGRVITEAGIKVRLQLGHVLARAKALCLSSDGTSHRNIKYEACHITYTAPTYSTDPNAPQQAVVTRLVDLDHALDHTSQSQFDGWDLNNAKIIDLYINSPLGRRDTLEAHAYEADDMWRKVVAYNSDHAADVVSAAYKSKNRKIGVIEKDLGRKQLEVRAEAMQSLARHLGSTALESLPQEQQQVLTRMVVAGCCKHKDHNCTKAGVAGMEGAYKRLGLTPPVLLANKDNAATIALGNEADSAAVERALKASQRGGYKVVSICGDLFRHKDDKRGHQDLHRHVFSKVKFNATGEHSTVKFPDTSNNRYGTHLAGAAELVTYHAAYIQFLRLIRNTKQTPGLNHMEENALKGLQDEETMCELIVMTVYKNTVPDAYCKIILDHIEKLIADTDLLLDPLSCLEDATLDGEPFPDEYAMDCVHYWLATHPARLLTVEKLLIAFLEASLPAWHRFSREFHAGGAIDSLTPAEKLLISIPPTNDANESILGGWRVYSRTRGGTVKKFSAQATYHRNNTEAFADAKLNTEEDALYVMQLARIEDANGAMKKFRNDLLAFKARVADEARRKQAEKQAEAAEELARLQSIVVITDPAALKALPVKKKGQPNLREQLDVHRMLWKDEVLAKTKLGDMSKKADMLAAILAANQRYDLYFFPGVLDVPARNSTRNISNINTAINAISRRF